MNIYQTESVTHSRVCLLTSCSHDGLTDWWRWRWWWTHHVFCMAAVCGFSAERRMRRKLLSLSRLQMMMMMMGGEWTLLISVWSGILVQRAGCFHVCWFLSHSHRRLVLRQIHSLTFDLCWGRPRWFFMIYVSLTAEHQTLIAVVKRNPSLGVLND